MPAASQSPRRAASTDLLFRHVRDLPYFRGLLRAVESVFYQDLDLAAPVYDLGCGDGHFASLTFDHPIDVGLDPWHGPIHQAGRLNAYRGLIEADAAHAPFPAGHFGSAFSNSVLEHIPHVQEVLNETSRILKPGAAFIFCVPNQNFTANLSVARFFDLLGLKWLGRAYRTFFNRISRHKHCDPVETWDRRLKIAGFEVEAYWHYFSPSALAALEWGHYLGLPAAICKLLFGRWILAPWRFNLWLTMALLRPYYNEPVPQERGAYTFYVTRRAAEREMGSRKQGKGERSVGPHGSLRP